MKDTEIHSLRYRIAAREDISAMLAIYAPFVRETAYSFEYEVPTPEIFEGRLTRFGEIFPWLVCEDVANDDILGYAYASPAFERAAYQWDADLSIYIAPRAQHRGIGKTFYLLLEDILRQQGYHNLYALVSSANAPSYAFHCAMGYALMAVMPKIGFKFGTWYDMNWFHKRLFPPAAPACAPVPFAPDMLQAALVRMSEREKVCNS